MKLYDSELKVMDTLWKEGDLPAKELARILGQQVGWNKNTTYTVIKKCVEKGAIRRMEPGFVCHALLSREEARREEVDILVEKYFDGSADLLFAALLDRQGLPPEVARRLQDMVAREEEKP